MLFIAPDGSDSMLQDRVAAPHIGFARIARAAGAKIAPVLFTGRADLDTLKFNVRGWVLEAFESAGLSENEILDEWCQRIGEAHAGDRLIVLK